MDKLFWIMLVILLGIVSFAQAGMDFATLRSQSKIPIIKASTEGIEFNENKEAYFVHQYQRFIREFTPQLEQLSRQAPSPETTQNNIEQLRGYIRDFTKNKNRNKPRAKEFQRRIEDAFLPLLTELEEARKGDDTHQFYKRMDYTRRYLQEIGRLVDGKEKDASRTGAVVRAGSRPVE